MRSVSYVVVTMNRCAEVVRCLRSLQAQNYPDTEIIVVDNQSSDGTARVVAEQFPEARLLVSTENLGAAGGRNLGIEAARGDICVFIDDDAELRDADATARLVSYFEGDEGLACLALRIRNPNTGDDDVKTIPRADKRVMENGYECSYFCGAGCAIRRDVLNELEGFWTKLFIYVEELELSYRILARGHRMWFAADIVVDHWETPTARPSSRAYHLMTRNRFLTAVRHLPWRFVATTVVLWWLRMGTQALARGEFRAYLRGINDSLTALSMVLELRAPLQPEVVRKISGLSGRLWY